MDAAGFVNFLAQGLTEEQEAIFEFVKGERNVAEYYKALANTYRELIGQLEKERNELKKSDATAASPNKDWALRVAAVAATPAVFTYAANFAGYVPVPGAKKIAFIKYVRRLSGLSLLESKMVAEYYMKSGLNLNVVPDRDTNWSEFAAFSQNIFDDIYSIFENYHK